MSETEEYGRKLEESLVDFIDGNDMKFTDSDSRRIADFMSGYMAACFAYGILREPEDGQDQ